ncbi:arsenite efflux protein-like protein [Chytriomyces sp. MP71]|nr:arsenite efflux protein-like protein [Chytriomyces sp. MP71]
MSTSPQTVLRKLSWLDRLLPINILIAMVIGTLIGHYVPNAATTLSSGSIAGVSAPIFVGLLVMMYPVLCKVRYEILPSLLKDASSIKVILFSLVLNIIVAPLIMTALAWATLPDLPHERTGVILIGVARCIAMVLIWNQLAGGDAEWCAILVAVNAIAQLLLYGPVAYFLTVVVSGSPDAGGMVDIWLVVRSVLVFLGIPLGAGCLTRCGLRFGIKGNAEWYDDKLMPAIGPFALLGLLYTILVMFILQGDQIIHNLGNAFRTMVPLICYFAIVFSCTLVASLYLLKSPHSLAITQSFTAAGNNFELAIAVAVATYGIDSKEAFSAVIGPLIEVPVLLGLVYVAVWTDGWYNLVLVKLKGPAMEEQSEAQMVVRSKQGTDGWASSA